MTSFSVRHQEAWHDNPYAGLGWEVRQQLNAPTFVYVCNLAHEHRAERDVKRCVHRQALERDARYGTGCKFSARGICQTHSAGTCPKLPWKEDG